MTEAFKKLILQIVDEASGGIKGLDLFTKIVQEQLRDPEIPKVSDLDEISDYVEREIPELGVLRYAMKLTDDTDREKFFFYRKLGHGNGSHPQE